MKTPTKRYRAPRAKAGELKAQWGRIEGCDPDLCYVWGDGVPSCDARLINNVFTAERARAAILNEPKKPFGIAFDPSFIDELKKRGYDLSTFQFSIRLTEIDHKTP